MLLHHVLTESTTVRPVYCLTKSRTHTTRFPLKYCSRPRLVQHANCSQKRLEPIRTHNRNIHNFSGLKIKFLHCTSLRFHTVDDIKHMADTSNCAWQYRHISIHTEMKVTGGLTPIALFYFLSCLVKKKKKQGVSVFCHCFFLLSIFLVGVPVKLLRTIIDSAIWSATQWMLL